MLQGLYVRNFALIDEISLSFRQGLNILTGETGAGKSILLGSIQMALGAKTSKEMIRSGASFASVELLFTDCNEAVLAKAAAMEVPLDGNDITISRRIMATGKSVSRINGETVTAAAVKELAALLLEIHGQQEHHTLLNKEKHLELIDRYAGEKARKHKETIKGLYRDYREARAELMAAREDATTKNRDCSYLTFAVNEITEAHYKKGEEEELEQAFQKLSHAKALADGVSAALFVVSEGNQETADELVNQAVRTLTRIADYDKDAEQLSLRMEEIANLISDFSHEARDYVQSLAGYEEEYQSVSERLSLFHQLKSKYGHTMEDVLLYAKECESKLERFSDYEGYLKGLEDKVVLLEKALTSESEELRKLRRKTADELQKKIVLSLSDLNFLDVRFDIRFEQTEFSANGFDSVEFYIATNPGEEIRPLTKVASGGELSRIMLALKSVFADRDEIPTMIFDEIDTGISGKTAQLVSEKMAVIARHRQLICITHLPQIASMADTHFCIEKVTDGKKTQTSIEELSENKSVHELARMLGGASITDAVLANAREMKALAARNKTAKQSI